MEIRKDRMCGNVFHQPLKEAARKHSHRSRSLLSSPALEFFHLLETFIRHQPHIIGHLYIIPVIFKRHHKRRIRRPTILTIRWHKIHV